MALPFEFTSEVIETSRAARRPYNYVGNVLQTIVLVHPDGTAPNDYCEQVKDRLVAQFKGGPRIEGVLCAIADEGTELEQGLINVQEFRSLDTAIGAQLDALGVMYDEPRNGETDGNYRRRLKAMAKIVASKGTVNDLLNVLITLDNGFSPSSIALIPHFPACVAMTVEVPSGEQLLGETMARLLKRTVASGVCFVLMFFESGETIFSWEDDPGGEWGEDGVPATGGIWAEAV